MQNLVNCTTIVEMWFFFLLLMISLLKKVLHDFMNNFTKFNYKPTGLLLCTLIMFCHDLNLGFKAKGMERHRPRVQLGNHIHTPGNVGQREGMNPHTPK
jgi:hypothetical protein